MGESFPQSRLSTALASRLSSYSSFATSAIFRRWWIGTLPDSHRRVSKCKIDKTRTGAPGAEHHDRVRQRQINGPSDIGGTLLNTGQPFPAAGKHHDQHQE